MAHSPKLPTCVKCQSPIRVMEPFREVADGRREHLVCPIDRQVAQAVSGIDDLLAIAKIRANSSKPRS